MQFTLPARFRVLSHRNFRLYWTGQLISLTGMWMQAVAGSWVVLELTGSTFALALVNFAVALPALLLTLFGGVAADRYDRHKILVWTQAAAMVLALVAGVLLALGVITFWQILLLSVLIGVVSAFDMPAQQALIPDLVEPREIPEAIALNQVIFNGSRLLGPGIAGVLIATLGLASAYFANGISYIAVIVSLLLLNLPPRRAAAPGPRRSPLMEMRAGLSYVGQSRLLVALMGIAAVTTLTIFPMVAVLSPAYVKDALGQGAGTSGLLMAASGGASLFGAFALLWVPAARRGLVMLGCAALGAGASLILAATANVALAATAFGLLSLAMSLIFGLAATTVQQMTPDAIRGRVMSVWSLMFSGVMPVAAIAAGVAVEATSIRLVYGVAGVLFAVPAAVLVLGGGLFTGEPRPVATPAPGVQPAEAA
jgi:MFS family permease